VFLETHYIHSRPTMRLTLAHCLKIILSKNTGWFHEYQSNLSF
jgi:hypothetical protein